MSLFNHYYINLNSIPIIGPINIYIYVMFCYVWVRVEIVIITVTQ
jgi:hypothetical protein